MARRSARMRPYTLTYGLVDEDEEDQMERIKAQSKREWEEQEAAKEIAKKARDDPNLWDPRIRCEYKRIFAVQADPLDDYNLYFSVEWEDRDGKNWDDEWRIRDDIPLSSFQGWEPQLLGVLRRKLAAEPRFFTRELRDELERRGIIVRGGSVRMSSWLKEEKRAYYAPAAGA